MRNHRDFGALRTPKRAAIPQSTRKRAGELIIRQSAAKRRTVKPRTLVIIRDDGFELGRIAMGKARARAASLFTGISRLRGMRSTNYPNQTSAALTDEIAIINHLFQIAHGDAARR